MNDRIQKLAEMALRDALFVNVDYSDVAQAIISAQGEEEKRRIIQSEAPKLYRINEYTLLTGAFPVIQLPTAESKADLGAVFSKYAFYENKLLIHAGNHKTADFQYAVTHGFKGYLERIRSAMQHYAGDSQKQHFLSELELACKMIVEWGRSFAAACRIAADEEENPLRKKELLKLEQICRRVPEGPAETFYEAVQSYFFFFTLFPDGLGRLDQYLYPFYKKDMAAGRLTREHALELVENLFILIFSHMGTQHEWSGINHGAVGGYTQDGRCGHNECTSIILEAVCELPVWRPQVSYRVTRKTTSSQLREVLEANMRRPDLVMFLMTT